MTQVLQSIFSRFCYLLFGANSLITLFVFALFFIGIFFLFEKKKLNKKWLILFSLLPVVVFFLRYLLNEYFLSDDFDHFIVVNKFSYWELFVKGLAAKGVWAFHRLFVGFWLFKFVYSLFGANYEAFMVVNFVLHMVNFYLLYSILKRLSRFKYTLCFSLFAFSFYYLSWISNIHELIAATFFLTTFKLLITKVIDKKDSLPITIFALISYFLGVSSKEFVFLLPFVFTLFLFAFHFYKKKVDLWKGIKKLTPFYLLGIIYLVIFAADYLGFSGFERGSGYRATFFAGHLFKNLSYYLDHRIKIIGPLTGFVVFTLLTVAADIYKKKPVLTPLYLSYLILLVPVAMLEKFEPYYSYIPSFFLFALLLIYSEYIVVFVKRRLGKGRHILFIFLAAFSFVYIFRVPSILQENCFLLQYPRQHARRVAVEGAVLKVDKALGQNKNKVDFSSERSEELRWFLSNDYIRYFLKSSRAFEYNYRYNQETGILEITKL